MQHQTQNWNESVFSKKFLSRIFTHRLNINIDNKKYEVVFEGRLNKLENVEADLVVYQKDDRFSPIMAMEICQNSEIADTVSFAYELLKKEQTLTDFFIYNLESNLWFGLKRNGASVVISAKSDFMGFSLNHLLDESPSFQSRELVA